MAGPGHPWRSGNRLYILRRDAVMSQANNILEALLALTRSRTSWNERLANWEKPASDHEETQIERTADQVRRALARNGWLSGQGVEVRPQGSYHNNTNVRLQADMDLCVWHPAIKIKYDAQVDQIAAYDAGGYWDRGITLADLAAVLRTQVYAQLVAAFGAHNVDPGKRAFTVKGIPGSRAPADVVPAFRLDHIRRGTGGSLLFPQFETVEGIYILGNNGSETINYPRQHHDNAVAKRARTAHRFKRVVRALKRLRDELVEMRVLGPKQAPSFLIESLVYAVNDIHFLIEEDRFDRTKRILEQIWGLLMNDLWVLLTAMEINDVKPLFSGQSWSVDDAKAFVRVAHARLTA
jgi:hypothetical protein